MTDNDNVISLHKKVDVILSKYDAQSIELERRSNDYFAAIDKMEDAILAVDVAMENVAKAEAFLKEMLDEIGDEYE